MKHATKTRVTRHSEILRPAKNVCGPEAVEDIQSLTSQREIDAVRTQPKVIYHLLTERGCQVERSILPALQGTSASQIREKIGVRKVGVFKAVEGIANHQKFAGREVVIYAASQVVSPQTGSGSHQLQGRLQNPSHALPAPPRGRPGKPVRSALICP